MGETKQKNEITKELENAEVLPFGKKDFNAYNRLMANIEKGFTKASEPLSQRMLPRTTWTETKVSLTVLLL